MGGEAKSAELASDAGAGLIDLPALEEWVRKHLPVATEAPLDVVRITSGGSNELFELTVGNDQWVLRRPLLVPQDAAAANKIMAREHRVLHALAGTEVPHPRPVALCEDTSVIGAAFYVMDKVDGFTTDGRFPEAIAASPSAQHHVGMAAVEALAALHAVDWLKVGLDGFGRPDGFLDRQVERWSGQLERNRTRDLPGIDHLAEWLRANQPPDGGPAIMHGDFTPHNWMFAVGPPPKLLAVVDWEQATIGDPLMDLGHLLAGWQDLGEEPRFASYLQPRDGLPARSELLDRYQERTDRDLSNIAFYEVLAMFKLACVLEGNFRLFVTGNSTNPKHERAGELVTSLIAAATLATRS